MKLGFEKKEERWKLYVLGGLAVVIVYFIWPDSTTSPGAAPASRPLAHAPVANSAETPGDTPTRRNRPSGRVVGDFRPKLRDQSPEKRPELTKVDPTIKLPLLARVQNVQLEGGSRNIFQFGPSTPVVPDKPLPKANQIAVGPIGGAPPLKPVNIGPPPDPSAPPIPFKYYGYSAVKGEPRKRAFFLDGEDVIVVYEGDMIKNRYRVVHVGLRSVEMEDTQFKNGKQSLPLAEELAG